VGRVAFFHPKMLSQPDRRIRRFPHTAFSQGHEKIPIRPAGAFPGWGRSQDLDFTGSPDHARHWTFRSPPCFCQTDKTPIRPAGAFPGWGRSQDLDFTGSPDHARHWTFRSPPCFCQTDKTPIRPAGAFPGWGRIKPPPPASFFNAPQNRRNNQARKVPSTRLTNLVHHPSGSILSETSKF
jgi:hypothetical protein